MTATWEETVKNPLMNGNFNMAQMTLAVTLNIENHLDEFEFRGTYPTLTAWASRMAERPSLRELLPHLAG